MGAVDFYETIYTSAAAKDAYRELCDSAAYERGHGGYTGTIAESQGFLMHPDFPRPVSEEAARLSAYAAMSYYDGDDDEESASREVARHRFRVEKWGPAGCIPLLPREAVSQRGVTVRVTVPGGRGFEAAAIEAAKAKVRLKTGETVVGASIVHLSYNTPEEERPEGSWKTTTDAFRGVASETRYFTIASGGNVHQQAMPKWEAGHPTQAAARAAAEEIADKATEAAVKSGNGYAVESPVTVEVIGITRREDGSPLVRVVNDVTKMTVSVQLKLERIDPTAGVGGYLFFGVASS